MNVSLFFRVATCLGASLWLGSVPAWAQRSLKAVVWHTPHDWDGYVNAEGKGLYVDIMEAVFTAQNIHVTRENVPWKRALYNVQVGKADFTGGTSPIPGYHVSRQPVIQGWEVIFFRKGLIAAPTLANLKDRKGVWPVGYIDEFPQEIKDKLHGNVISNRGQGVRMVLSGRTDYYLDNLVQLSDTLDTLSFTRQEFECREVFSAKLHMLFTRNVRGRKLRDFFDDQMERLTKSGELKKIYEKWSATLPQTFTEHSEHMDFLHRCEKKPGL